MTNNTRLIIDYKNSVLDILFNLAWPNYYSSHFSITSIEHVLYFIINKYVAVNSNKQKLIESLTIWFSKHPISTNIIIYLAWILLVFLIITWVRRILKKILPDNTIKYKTQKGVEILGYILIILITITYFTGSIKDFGLAIGLLTAGITITLQEIILSIAGSFYIFFVKVYKPGDRI